ncbi:MAG: M2 family metallopeptidase [Anaerolineales bacterium]|jgi:peptidyl-dipeptidase A
MKKETLAFCSQVIEAVRPLHLTYTRAAWEAATTGSEAANQSEREAQAALMRFWADPVQFAEAKRLYEANHADPLTLRTIKRIYLSAAKAQQDEATIERVTELEAQVRDRFYNSRVEIEGQSLNDNEVDQILKTSHDSGQVRDVWLASKVLGTEVAQAVRELARVRNQAAQAQGFRDHFQRALTLNEIDEGQLIETLGRLDDETTPLYQQYKAGLDRSRAEWFGIEPGDLMPWHFGSRFFQDVPESETSELSGSFETHDPIELALATYDGLGLEVRDILDRSDLYPRPGKDQHAFCLDIDRSGDVRTLNNLQPDRKWSTTLLHELGHAVFDKFIDPGLPWILRTPPHPLSTEAIALMMGGLTSDPEWLVQILRIPDGQAQSLAETARQRVRAERLIFTRWVLVMTNFEHRLYADPESDLDRTWWELVQRYQRLTPPPGRQAPDWAAKYHIGLVPVYYQNYELGLLVTAQFEDHIHRRWRGIVNRPEVGTWLREKVFAPGCSLDWAAHVAHVTGEKLDSVHFVASLA